MTATSLLALAVAGFGLAFVGVAIVLRRIEKRIDRIDPEPR